MQCKIGSPYGVTKWQSVFGRTCGCHGNRGVRDELILAACLCIAKFLTAVGSIKKAKVLAEDFRTAQSSDSDGCCAGPCKVAFDRTTKKQARPRDIVRPIGRIISAFRKLLRTLRIQFRQFACRDPVSGMTWQKGVHCVNTNISQ